MNLFSRVISASLSPNTEIDDVWEAVKTVFSPWKWKMGREVAFVQDWFRARFGGDIVLFNSGRSALLAILKAFDIGADDEVIVQAFTCVAVPNSVRWAGAKPIFCDIDDSYNLDPEKIQISSKTKAIIVQHTFGKSANMKAILSITKKHKLIVIEDFAHTMSLPMQGDAAFFSFGRDKVLSSVWGGGAIINIKYQISNIKLKLHEIQNQLPMPGYFWIFQQLLHPIVFALILPTYNLGIGKVLLVLLQRLKLLSFPVYPEEKKGEQPTDFPAKYPNALAAFLNRQLHKLDRYTRQREAITKMYGGQGVYLRFPMRVEDPDELHARAKREGILIGNWYHNVVDPAGVNWEAVGYKRGSCPKAEHAAKYIMNLPTRIPSSDAKRICRVVEFRHAKRSLRVE